METIRYCVTHGYAHEGERPDHNPCKVEHWPIMEGEVVAEGIVVNPEPVTFIIKAGDLCYLDAFNGLVPCKVTAIDDDGVSTVKVTAPRPGYTRGEVLHMRPGLTLVKRSQVWWHRRQLHVAGPVRLLTDSGRLLP